jgi:hypothetical protein
MNHCTHYPLLEQMRAAVGGEATHQDKHYHHMHPASNGRCLLPPCPSTSQARVIDFTVDQIQQTLTHEMLICWSLLLAACGPMTLQQLSEQAGLLLSAMCGQQVRQAGALKCCWVCWLAAAAGGSGNARLV